MGTRLKTKNVQPQTRFFVIISGIHGPPLGTVEQKSTQRRTIPCLAMLRHSLQEEGTSSPPTRAPRDWAKEKQINHECSHMPKPPTRRQPHRKYMKINRKACLVHPRNGNCSVVGVQHREEGPFPRYTTMLLIQGFIGGI